jgi:hypothetical protein
MLHHNGLHYNATSLLWQFLQHTHGHKTHEDDNNKQILRKRQACTKATPTAKQHDVFRFNIETQIFNCNLHESEGNAQASKYTTCKHKIHLINLHLHLQDLPLQGVPYILVPLKLSPIHSCVAWVAVARTIFDGATLMPFGATDVFEGIAFQPDPFACFPEGSTSASLLLFFAASSHALEHKACVETVPNGGQEHWSAQKLCSPDLHLAQSQHKPYALHRHTGQQRSL